MYQNLGQLIEQTHLVLYQRSAVNDARFQQTLQRETFRHA